MQIVNLGSQVVDFVSQHVDLGIRVIKLLVFVGQLLFQVTHLTGKLRVLVQCVVQLCFGGAARNAGHKERNEED